MSTARKVLVLACTVPACVFACASRTAVTTWYYSSWFLESGGGSLGTFQAARSSCLEQAGIDDPAAVKPNGPEEVHFIECMNAAGWCTNAFHCDKPGAS
jgi:hypothetical protein